MALRGCCVGAHHARAAGTATIPAKHCGPLLDTAQLLAGMALWFCCPSVPAKWHFQDLLTSAVLLLRGFSVPTPPHPRRLSTCTRRHYTISQQPAASCSQSTTQRARFAGRNLWGLSAHRIDGGHPFPPVLPQAWWRRPPTWPRCGRSLRGRGSTAWSTRCSAARAAASWRRCTTTAA